MHAQSLACLTLTNLNRTEKKFSHGSNLSAIDAENGRKNKLRKSKRKVGKRGVKFCPKCGATNVFWASGLPQLWSIWECKNCGYRGAFVIEDGELAQKLREKYSRENAEK